MCRMRWLLTLGMAVLPSTSPALQLHWVSGATNVDFSEAVQCTLLVAADSAQTTLPSEWRLLWVADTSAVQFTPLDSLLACQADTAEISSIDGPATSADSAANLITAHLCSAGMTGASTASYLIDVPGGTHGKLKVVALDPADSTTVIESNEVTCNGGIEGDYAPVILRAASVHQSLRLRVTAIGAGLRAARLLSLTATDASWTLPLTIAAQSNSVIAGEALVAALLPACRTSVAATSGGVSEAWLPADGEPEPLVPEGGGCSAQYFEELLQPPPPGLGYTILPKDFSFAPGFVDTTTNRYALHLFYIRHSLYTLPDDSKERNIGHAWSSDFVSWHGPAAGDKPDTTALVVRPGMFDALHVWAPTIVHPPGPTFYMFYTGVGHEQIAPGVFRNHQRIGVATSTDLNTWTPADTVVLSAPQIPWVKKNPVTYGGSQQLRDPFVMEYPVGSGNYIMYFAAVDSLTGSAEDMAIGAAKSSDLRNWIPLPLPFAATERSTFQGHTHVVESPHLFTHNGQWWMPYTVNNSQIFFETTTSADPTDTLATHWASPVWLRGVSQGRPAELQYWHASEHLRFGNSTYEWLAAYDDNATSIDIKGVFPTDSAGVDSLLLDCPPKPPVAGIDETRRVPGQLRLVVLRPDLGDADVGLRIELPWRTSARLVVYDVAGRRLTTLVDRELPAGVTNVKWNGTDEGGVHVSTGIYFVRLSCAKGARASKIVMLR